MQTNLVWFAVGISAGAWLVLQLKPANNTTCCARVAIAARDQLATATHTGRVGATLLDLLGITNYLPAIIDAAGVPIG